MIFNENRMGVYDKKTEDLGRLLFVLDLCLTTLTYISAYWLRELFYVTKDHYLYSHIALMPAFLIPFAFLLSFFGVYKGFRSIPIFDYCWALLRSIFFCMSFYLVLVFLLNIQYVSRGFVVIFGFLVFIVLSLVRSALVWWYFHKAVQKDENYRKVLIIGTGPRAEMLSKALSQVSEWGVHIVGHLDLEQKLVGTKVLDSKVIGTVGDISNVLKDNVVDEVIIAMPRSMMNDMEEVANVCEDEGVMLRLMADMFDLQVGKVNLAEVGGIPLLSMEPVAQDSAMLLVKRLVDLTLVLMFMPVLLPMFAVIAIAIKLDSSGPVFFTQARVGLNKRIFKMYKFRSMVPGSENMLKQLEHLNEAEGPIFKIANDPRVTKVGTFLRKTSLDEFPQLLNVLMGHMSLVGPRPMSVRDVSLFDKGAQRKRFSVRPGLTCLWQISGRSNLPFTKWLELDLAYIQHWSLGLDFKILLKTIPVIFKGTGAV